MAAGSNRLHMAFRNVRRVVIDAPGGEGRVRGLTQDENREEHHGSMHATFSLKPLRDDLLTRC
jgi:hypothetical protein